MKRIYLVTLTGLALCSVLQAATSDRASAQTDRDLDGVIDRYDRCPHTPFFALVNKNGCMIKRLKVSPEREREVKKLLTKNN